MKPWNMRQLLKVISTESTCVRGHVAAIIERAGRIISTGYNGAPSGMDHCTEVGCEIGPDGGCVRCVHAEANAIAFAARHGIATEGATLWCSSAPCYTCAKLIINAGVIKVVYYDDYRDKKGVNLLREAGVEVVQMSAM